MASRLLGAMVWAGAAGASAMASAGCTEPARPAAVYALSSIRGVPLPAASDRMGVRMDPASDSITIIEMEVLSGTFTLFSDNTWRIERDVVRKVNGVVTEDLGRRSMWGTYRWNGDRLTVTIEGPPLPEGGFSTGGPDWYDALDNRRILRGPEGNDWMYEYVRMSNSP